ncbi:MAG: hypothetical protein ONB30_11445 [candidate division KSB1 bacterium]|nr:hypothetical protein [candidate division KSB1 bacterium]
MTGRARAQRQRVLSDLSRTLGRLARVHPWRGVLWACVGLCMLRCTHNPFSEDNIRLEGGEVRGTVSLDKGPSPEGVYVWLEKFDVATLTDARGEFRLPLGTVAAHAGAGITGSFRLFFYVGNYGVKTAELVLRQGELVPGHGDVGPGGDLRTPVLLSRLLEVTTQVAPDTFPPRVGGDVSPGTFAGAYIDVTVTLRADVDSLPVLVPSSSGGPAALLMVRALDPGAALQTLPRESEAALSRPLVADTVTALGRTWSSRFYLAMGALPRGTYEVVPFVIVPQRELPGALLRNLGVSEAPGLAYLRMPFKRKGGVLTVLR